MKLSERFDRRYQQAPPPAPAPGPAPAPAEPAASDGPTTVAPVERRTVAREPVASAAVVATAEAPPRSDQGGQLSPALSAAKTEIHALLLARHAGAIDINNRAGIRRLLTQLTEDHFRAKPPAVLITAADRERLVEILFDDVIGLGPLESLLRDPGITEIMVNRPEQIFVERAGASGGATTAADAAGSRATVLRSIGATVAGPSEAAGSA
ncbi:MAG: hypothetical protein ACXWMN_04115, partial [Candidatus Limnocylindria bacterium]